MSAQVSRSNSLKRRHWSIRAHESLICRNKDGHFCLNVEGGAELGLFPYIGDLRQDRINYRVGKLHTGEVILEVNHKRVPGMIKKDVIALIKRSADPVSLVTVKQSESLPRCTPHPSLPHKDCYRKSRLAALLPLGNNGGETAQLTFVCVWDGGGMFGYCELYQLLRCGMRSSIGTMY